MVTPDPIESPSFELFDIPRPRRNCPSTLELPFDCANGFAPSYSLKPYIRFAC